MAFRKLNLQMANSQVTDFDDSVVVLGRNNTLEVDVGFLGKKADNNYTGLVRDSETNAFILIENISLENSQINNIDSNDVNLTKAKLEVHTLDVESGIVLPKGPANSRPLSPVEGQLWFNTETKMFEGYNGTSWVVFVPATLQIT